MKETGKEDTGRKKPKKRQSTNNIQREQTRYKSARIPRKLRSKISKRIKHSNPETIYNPEEVMRSIPTAFKTPVCFMIFFLLIMLLISSMSSSTVSASPQRSVGQDNWFDAMNEGLPEGDESTMEFPFGCNSNQQCIMDSVDMMDQGWMDSPLPYCWKNGECRGERQLVMQLNSPVEDNTTVATNKYYTAPYPVFHEGEEMCVTIMFNPSLVLIDDLWPDGQEEDQASLQQERLLLFQSIPLRITLQRMWMCSSRKNLRKNTPNTNTPVGSMFPNLIGAFSSLSGQSDQQDVVPHTYIRHYDQSNKETGCLTDSHYVRKHLIYGTRTTDEISANEGVLYWSKSGLSSKICFPAKVLGPPDVPCFIDAEVSIELQPKELNQDFEPYAPLIESFGVDPTGKALPFYTPEQEDREMQCGSTMTKVKEAKHTKRTHGNRDHKIGKHDEQKGGYCKTKGQPKNSKDWDSNTPRSFMTVTSSDTLSPHPTTRKTPVMIDRQEQDEDVVQGKIYQREMQHEDHVQNHPRARTVGYYYYYDPEAKGYYYYHPHVHCGWNLKFNRGAGICEVPGRLHSDVTHVAIIVLATIGIGVGLIYFIMDWKSRVLFIRGG